MSDNKNRISIFGISSVFTAFFLWGVLPFYWKQLEGVAPEQILANRVIWSFIFVLILLFAQARTKELGNLLRNGNNSTLFLCGFIISLNWFTYIYAVNTNHIVEASLGYYISPLLTIFLGRVVLKETLNRLQAIALILAFIGVGIITLSFGSIPLIAIILALTFSTYGLIKKKTNLDVTLGLAVETLAVTPIALGYLLFLSLKGEHIYTSLTSYELLFLIGTGIITAIPLLLFSYGAQKLPLTTIGFIQYSAPTISLFIGIFLYDEPFTMIHFLTFGFIWAALLIYSLSHIRLHLRLTGVLSSSNSGLITRSKGIPSKND